MIAAGLEPMAKKKVEPARVRSGQDIIVTYKADRSVSAEFKAWLDGLAAEVGAPVTVTIDMALKEFAARRNYAPMPRRLIR